MSDFNEIISEITFEDNSVGVASNGSSQKTCSDDISEERVGGNEDFPVIILPENAPFYLLKNNEKCKSKAWDYFRKIAHKMKAPLTLSKSKTPMIDVACLVCLAKELERVRKTDQKIDLGAFSVEYDTVTKLKRHLQQSHKDIAKRYIELKVEEHISSGKSVGSYFSNGSKFHQKCIKWIVNTYQPFTVVEDASFREMIKSLNDSPNLQTDMTARFVRDQIGERAAVARAGLKAILKDREVAITLDKWTSIMITQYLGITVHFISDDWTIEKICLQCLPTNSEKSTAEDIFRDVHEAIKDFIDIEQLTAIVTDTEATMNKFGRLVKQKWNVDWIGCACHVIEITTGIAFNGAGDIFQKEALEAARRLVGYYRRSSQKMDELKKKQPIITTTNSSGHVYTSTPLMLIEDVSTRWWSTYTMAERLIKLKPYIEALYQEKVSTMTLTDEQWTYISNLSKGLKPFMVAQKHFEGEKYVTISLVPGMIEGIRQHLILWLDDATSSMSSRETAGKLFADFAEEWGTGMYKVIKSSFYSSRMLLLLLIYFNR
jgi:hypothetical protein